MPKDSKKVSSRKPDEKYYIEHIQRGVEAARRGEFATEAEAKAFFDKYGKPSRSIVSSAKKKLKNG